MSGAGTVEWLGEIEPGSTPVRALLPRIQHELRIDSLSAVPIISILRQRWFAASVKQICTKDGTLIWSIVVTRWEQDALYMRARRFALIA